MSNPIVPPSRQNENTWASFHCRVSGIAFNYEELFSDTVLKFLEAKAKSIGYLLPSLMTVISFLLANSDVQFLNGTHLQLLNLYTMSALLMESIFVI